MKIIQGGVIFIIKKLGELKIKVGSIYIIRNTINNKVYIGQTTMTVRDRFLAHMKPSTIKRKRTYKLYNAVSKYGSDNFYVETLEENIPLELLDEKEIEYIHKFNSYKNGYNSTLGGDGRTINKLNNEEELLSLAKSGASPDELSEKFNVHKTTILRTLHKLGFYYYTNPEEVSKLFDLGYSNSEIAKELKCNKQTVSRILNRIGKRRRRIPITKREGFDFVGLFRDYDEGMPVKTLCEKYDISESVFRRVNNNRNNFMKT